MCFPSPRSVSRSGYFLRTFPLSRTKEPWSRWSHIGPYTAEHVINPSVLNYHYLSMSLPPSMCLHLSHFFTALQQTPASHLAHQWIHSLQSPPAPGCALVVQWIPVFHQLWARRMYLGEQVLHFGLFIAESAWQTTQVGRGGGQTPT